MKVDMEEAKYQSEQRKEAIERAKTLLYHQTDRVKQFHVSHHTPIAAAASVLLRLHRDRFAYFRQ